MSRPSISDSTIQQFLSYDPETGNFMWLASVNSRARKGSLAGHVDYLGYNTIRLMNRKYLAHRLAWFFAHGRWPNGFIDHIDGNRANNAICNLRDVSHRVNQQNQKKGNKRSSTGLLGVSPRAGNKWAMSIRLPTGKRMFRCGFSSKEEAYAAYLEQKRIHHEGNTL